MGFFNQKTRQNSTIPPCWAKKRRRWPGQLGHQVYRCQTHGKSVKRRKCSEEIRTETIWNPKFCLEIFESLINTRNRFLKRMVQLKHTQIQKFWWASRSASIFVLLQYASICHICVLLWWACHILRGFFDYGSSTYPPPAYPSQKQGPIKGLLTVGFP